VQYCQYEDVSVKGIAIYRIKLQYRYAIAVCLQKDNISQSLTGRCGFYSESYGGLKMKWQLVDGTLRWPVLKV